MVHMGDEFQAVAHVQLFGDLAATMRAEHHVPLVRVVEAEREGGQEHARRHAARPVDGEHVHAFDHAVAHGVDELEVACDRTGGERSDGQFSARKLLHFVGPAFEDGIAGRARLPGGLDAPGHALRGCGLNVENARSHRGGTGAKTELRQEGATPFDKRGRCGIGVRVCFECVSHVSSQGFGDRYEHPFCGILLPDFLVLRRKPPSTRSIAIFLLS